MTAKRKFPVTAKVYFGVWHGFDIEAFGEPKRLSEKEINVDGYPAKGGTLGFNKQAQSEAYETVRAFLNKHIGLGK